MKGEEMTEQEVLELVRRELLEIFEEANARSRQGSSGGGFGTSAADMSSGKGAPTEYLIQALRERMGGDQK
jgi:hypothetical protein